MTQAARRPFLAALAAVLALTAPLLAHPTPFSFVDIRLTGRTIDLTVVAHIFDVAHELGIDPPERLLDSSVAEPRQRDIVELVTSRIHLAFQVESREQVERVYRAGLSAGGRDNGQPGERHYHPGYFAAFLLDPDGNNIEAVHHGRAERSAPSVVITA